MACIYHAAAFAMGLVEDDKGWYIALEEAANVASASQMRSLFVMMHLDSL